MATRLTTSPHCVCMVKYDNTVPKRALPPSCQCSALALVQCAILHFLHAVLTRGCRCLPDGRSRKGPDLVEVHHPHAYKAIVAGARHQFAVLLIQAHVAHLQHDQAFAQMKRWMHSFFFLQKGLLLSSRSSRLGSQP